MKYSNILFAVIFFLVIILMFVSSGSLRKGLSYNKISTTPISSIPSPTPLAASPIEYDTSCIKDEDCLLIDTDVSDICCGDSCKPADYSKDNWIAINEVKYLQYKEKQCAARGVCSPGRLCDPKPINDSYTAKCVKNICSKVL